LRFRKPNNNLIDWVALTAVVLLIILFFGLRPKGLRLENPVKLLPEQGSIIFAKNGLAYVEDLVAVPRPGPAGELTIAMAVRADDPAVCRMRLRSLLMLHDGSDREQLLVAQWGSAIVVMNGDDYDHTRRLPRVAVRDVFVGDTIRLITVTTGTPGTRLYIDGVLAAARDDWRLQIPTGGPPLQMVLGNSVRGNKTWRGTMHGLAVYDRSLSSAAVKERYDRWVESGRFPHDPVDDPLVLYTFDGREGRVVPDRSGNHLDLQIPRRPLALQVKILELPWPNFKLDGPVVGDMLLNLVGFTPLGFALAGLLGAGGRLSGRRVLWGAVAGCFVVSLSMEILQAWMITRNSSLLDLFLNTAGGWVGAGIKAGYKRERIVYGL
jgi:hypothetical protein